MAAVSIPNGTASSTVSDEGQVAGACWGQHSAQQEQEAVEESICVGSQSASSRQPQAPKACCCTLLLSLWLLLCSFLMLQVSGQPRYYELLVPVL